MSSFNLNERSFSSNSAQFTNPIALELNKYMSTMSDAQILSLIRDGLFYRNLKKQTNQQTINGGNNF